MVGIRAMDGNTIPKFSTLVFPGETEELTSEDRFYVSGTHGPPSEPWVRKTCLVTVQAKVWRCLLRLLMDVRPVINISRI